VNERQEEKEEEKQEKEEKEYVISKQIGTLK
jgi:hypothetical protein